MPEVRAPTSVKEAGGRQAERLPMSVEAAASVALLGSTAVVMVAAWRFGRPRKWRGLMKSAVTSGEATSRARERVVNMFAVVFCLMMDS